MDYGSMSSYGVKVQHTHSQSRSSMALVISGRTASSAGSETQITHTHSPFAHVVVKEKLLGSHTWKGK